MGDRRFDWRDGERTVDKTGARPEPIKLPDERHGVLFVFEVYERVSYALIISVNRRSLMRPELRGEVGMYIVVR